MDKRETDKEEDGEEERRVQTIIASRRKGDMGRGWKKGVE